MSERFDTGFMQATIYGCDGVLVQMLGGASAATLDREACIRLRAVLDAAIGDGWRDGKPEAIGWYEVTVRDSTAARTAKWCGGEWRDGAGINITSRVVAYRPLPAPWGGKE